MLAIRSDSDFKGPKTMFEALSSVFLGACMLMSSGPPDIAGKWAGEDWGDVVLKQTNAGEYSGTYSETNGTKSGEMKLKWSPVENRFNGTWSEGQERFGELSIRLVGKEIHGAYTSLLKTKANPASPGLGDLRWSSGQGKLARPLDLRTVYHTSATQFVKEKRFPWSTVPRGSNKLGNVPLAIDGRLCLWGASSAQMGLKFPERSRDIPVNRTFEMLYIYHTTFFQSDEGVPVFHMTMDYADGTSSSIDVCYGTHVRDWYQLPEDNKADVSDPNSKMVWRDNHPDTPPERRTKLRFYVTSIANPKPELEVKTIKLASAKGNSAACILAMTTGPANLLKVEADEIAPEVAPVK
jgi:hypothetical protein